MIKKMKNKLIINKQKKTGLNKPYLPDVYFTCLALALTSVVQVLI